MYEEANKLNCDHKNDTQVNERTNERKHVEDISLHDDDDDHSSAPPHLVECKQKFKCKNDTLAQQQQHNKK